MASPTVCIRGSTLTGTRHQGVRRFLNVPYALPPTGDYRFLKPRALPREYQYGDVDCTVFGPICPQPLYFVGDTPIGHPPVGSTMSEDCLKLNIWIPDREAPVDGWPCLVFVHGGWLQVGSPNHDPMSDPTLLVSADGLQLDAIVISIGYRLNVFGFFAGTGHPGNAGLFDQRCALEYIRDNIHFFGGDPSKVTLSGLSAGANSVHNQLHYACLQKPDEKPLFQRVVMYSNALSAQPKMPAEVDVQVDELCAAFDITATEMSERLAALRKIKDTDLAAKLLSLKHHTFRPGTDGSGTECFIPPGSANLAETGHLATWLQEHKIQLMLGETENEEQTYRAVNPPTSRATFLPQLENYYKADRAAALMEHVRDTLSANEDDVEGWKDVFGAIVAAAQVRASQRHFIHALIQHGMPLSSIHRYRVAYRLGFYSQLGVPESMGVAHGMCQPIWWYQKQLGFSGEEVAAVHDWLEPWKAFVCQNDGDEGISRDWGCTNVQQYRRFNEDGSVSVEKDEDWDRMLAIGQVLMS
ncbi:Alpha/Beta hydrolase protein [Protomyces lactucae-debilis]|uniref:Carboxylic ester hydrolase n=1 Tax=Protomyces lactucae-debilis TaxID=2754530 RepID=A0A1Y2F6A4_PROLT|nr:Alpha/Beta hydrolase protein [Protomyces lactucae-debilis]ORY79014.1 Alpha/Beta hydrolase protein [Protomyces lactucae-debilis]